MAKVSIIVPIYGVEKYLRECVDSILNQTLEDIEILLIDDGGKDSCPQFCDEYAKNDSRVKVIHKQNGGYGQTCNVGLDNATGDYVAIVEPDDYIDTKMYEDLYKIAKDYDSDIVKSCFYDNLQINGQTYCTKTKWDIDLIPSDRSFTVKECPLFLFYHPSIWSCIYKREFIEKHNIRFVEAPGAGWTDNPFQVQTLCLAEKINYTDNGYYYWRRLNENESDDLKDYTVPFKRSDEIHEWLEKNNIIDANILANLYKRELGYIHIVLGKKHLSDKKECMSLIKRMLERMDKNIVDALNDKYKKEYLTFLNNPMAVHRKALFRRFRKNIISIRLNKKQKSIKIFGKVIYNT